MAVTHVPGTREFDVDMTKTVRLSLTAAAVCGSDMSFVHKSVVLHELLGVAVGDAARIVLLVARDE